MAAVAGVSGCQRDGGVTPDPRPTTVTGILELGTLAGHTWSLAAAINDRGQIAGSSGYTFVYPDTGHYRQSFLVSRPFVWQNGQMSDLSGLAQNTLRLAEAEAINSEGVVAGTYAGSDYYTGGGGGLRGVL